MHRFRSFLVPTLAVTTALGAAWGSKLTAQQTTSSQGPAPINIVSGSGGKNYLNLGLDALFAAGGSTEADVQQLETGGHDPAQNGFNVQNVELVLDGAVDPYFRGQMNLIAQITPDGETNVELEEIFATTTSLPHGLQVKAGQFLTEFGRINPTHPHTWDFVDQPLVEGLMFGGDGLRSTGVRASWLMPVPVYSEILLAVQNAYGETLPGFGGVEGDVYFGRVLMPELVHSASDLLFAPRYNASIDIGDTQTILVGTSGAFGPNSTGDGGYTRVGGIDFFWKWKSVRANKGFPFVKVQVEGMTRAYDAAATDVYPEQVFHDHGAYAQVVWGVKPMWTVGARYGTVGGDVGDDPTDTRFLPRKRASVMGTWYPTEYSKLRLQYSYDDRTSLENAQSVWLQFEFLLGAHAAHKF